MRTAIWKVSVQVDDHWHEVAAGRIVHVACQATPDWVDIWFENADMKTRKFTVVGTGHPIPENAEYVGTALAVGGALVWHVVESTDG